MGTLGKARRGMTTLSEIKHTDAEQQARFVSMTSEQQMLEIWLNTRETNGHVADAMRDIGEINQWRADELKPWIESVDKKLIAAGAVLGFILIAAPFVFFFLDNWRNP